MKLKYTILYVQDVAMTVAFYESAFGLSCKMQHPGGDYAEMDTGATLLAFSSHDLMQQLGKTPAHPAPESPVFEIAFETDDVDAALERALREGAKLVQAASQQPWGQTISYVSDLNGYLVEICSPVSP